MELDFKWIGFSIKDGIGYLEIKNPPANKMTQEFFDEFSRFILNYDFEGLKGLIITGQGKHYSTGADVEGLKAMIDRESLWEENRLLKLPEGHLKDKKSFLSLSRLSIPVISVITGFCMGSGFELALNSHIRICEENAKVGLPESTFGFLPALGGCYHCFRLSGLQTALDVVLRGDLYSPRELQTVGLIHMVVGKKEGLRTAELLISDINAGLLDYNKEDAQYFIDMFNQERIQNG